MTEMRALITRNMKLYVKDKGVFFTSLITPVILLVLYVTFLGNVYQDTLDSIMSGVGVTLSEELAGGFVGGQLVSSLLGVTCVTVAFCANMIMVQDKFNGTYKDLTMSPVRKSTLGFSYFIATELNTLIVACIAICVSFVYLAFMGWYLSVVDVFLLLINVFLTVTFGTLLSSVVNFFLSTQGQVSAIGSAVSSGYGFLCGAYMPISMLGGVMQNVLAFFPGCYATCLIRNNLMGGALKEMEKQNIPLEVVNELKNSYDCNLFFFGERVEVWAMYLVVLGTIFALAFVYYALNKSTEKGNRK